MCVFYSCVSDDTFYSFNLRSSILSIVSGSKLDLDGALVGRNYNLQMSIFQKFGKS